VERKFWQPETEYQISFSEGRNVLLFPIKYFKLNFATLAYPKIKSFFPANGAKDVVFDIEDPVVVDFDKSVAEFLVKFTIDPFGDLAYQNNPEKTQFKILPKEKSKEGEKYRFKVYIKYRNDADENYKEIYSSSFETLPLAPQNWEKDFSARLVQAKKFTRAKIEEGKYIDINLAVQILSIFENGEIIDAFLVSSGKKGMETPVGQYAIRNKNPRAWSKVYGLYMPFWMAMVSDGRFGIHELPEWPSGYKEGAIHLGIPVSHGCVRLGVGPAKTVYDWAEIGTPIVIY
jgi:lipoprotein-anchoring transpeptidase ErfK/SrfK